MIKLSKVYKIIIVIVTLYMLRYFDLLLYMPINNRRALLNFMVVFIGILLSIPVIVHARGDNELRKQTLIVNRYMVIYVPIMLIEMVYTFYVYDYGVRETLYTYVPFGYIFYAYAIIYILYADGSYLPFLKKIMIIVLGMLLIKTFSWLVYNSTGMIMFESIFAQYTGWARNEVVRLDIGYLFGLTFSLLLYYTLTHKQFIYKLLVVGMFLFAAIITRYRFLIGVLIIEVAVIYYYSSRTNNKKATRLLVLSIILGLFVALGGFEYVLNSFSIQGIYQSSTLARIEGAIHYWNLMVDKKAIIGLGPLSYENSTTLTMLYKTINSNYWLEDLGILGGFFRFGVFAFPIYGLLFYYAIKVVRLAIRCKSRDELLLITGVVCYMIVSCIMLNVFDTQRAYNVPFDLALISYINWRLKTTYNQ